MPSPALKVGQRWPAALVAAIVLGWLVALSVPASAVSVDLRSHAGSQQTTTVTFGLTPEPPTLDPQIQRGDPSKGGFHENIFETLFKINSDGELVPSLATK